MAGTTKFPAGVDDFQPLAGNTPENAVPLPGGDTGGHHDLLNLYASAIQALEFRALSAAAIPGLRGEDGEDAPIIPGQAGTAGVAGANGAAGPPGMSGDDGDDGYCIPGTAGAAGAAGSSSGSGTTTPGQQGEPGEDAPYMPATVQSLHYRRDDITFDGVQNAVTLGGDPYEGCAEIIMRSGTATRFILQSELTVSGRGYTLNYTPANNDVGVVAYWSQVAVATQSILGANDPYFGKVTALLHMDGANGSTTFTDQIGATWTPSGGATLSTTQFKYGTASLLCATASSKYISAPAISGYDFGSGDFTIELWVRPNTLTATLQAVICNRQQPSSNGGFNFVVSNASSSIVFFDSSGANINPLGAAPTVNAQNHIAVCRLGNVWTTYVNGVGGTPVTSSLVVGATTGALFIGRDSSSSTPRYADAYIDDVRITKGVARYTSNFTPQAFAFQNA